MIYNCVATVSRMTGNDTSKAYVESATDVRLLIQSASPEIIAIYGELPSSNLCAFNVVSGIDEIRSEDKITITNALQGPYSISDEFIVRGESEKTVVLGKKIISGVCIKK